ncbi:MAG: hypothetical protein R2862_11445 [Thermoanaerobaculia bacterium]
MRANSSTPSRRGVAGLQEHRPGGEDRHFEEQDEEDQHVHPVKSQQPAVPERRQQLTACHLVRAESASDRPHEQEDDSDDTVPPHQSF